MQVLSIPVTQTTIQTGSITKEKDVKLQAYLEHIRWHEDTFTNTKLEAMLAASCLRFLEGLTDISFVVGLAKEIRRRYRRTMKLSLWYSTDILDTLAVQLKDKSTDTEEINKLVNDAQELITKRRYLSEILIKKKEIA